MNATLNISTDTAGAVRHRTPAEISYLAAFAAIVEGVEATAVPTWSAVKGSKPEPGCCLELFDVNPGQVVDVFGALKEDLGLGCAWLETSTGYAGCILKWEHWEEYDLDTLDAEHYAMLSEFFPVDPNGPTGPTRDEAVAEAARHRLDSERRNGERRS